MPNAPALPTLPLAHARAFSLARQGLAGDGHASSLDAVRAIGGVYGTAPTCYLSCVARVDGLRITDLDVELYERRTIVRHRAMRQSNYAVAVADLAVVVGATGTGARKAEARILASAASTRPVTSAVRSRGDGLPPTRSAAGCAARSARTPAHARPCVRRRAPGRQCRVLRARVRGGWQSDVYAYATWGDWLGAPAEPPEPAVARAELARRYLRSAPPRRTICAGGPGGRPATRARRSRRSATRCSTWRSTTRARR